MALYCYHPLVFKPPKGLTMYTAQVNSFGNIIVCKGSVVRNSYRIIFTGSYADCLAVKANP